MTDDTPISDLLAAPLSPDWTVEWLAEQVLGTIAAHSSQETQEFILDAQTTKDRQSQRILRPLLACLASKSAAEGGTPANVYSGHLLFKRPGSDGPVWISGLFENGPGIARVALRRSFSPPSNSDSTKPEPPAGTGANSRLSASHAPPSRSANDVASIHARNSQS